MAVDFTNYVASQRGAVSQVDKYSSSDPLISGQANLASSYDTFLTLLTTQLKNQDPTSPLDTNAFTQQLVQMTGVQQQLLSNQLLKQMVVQGQNADMNDALGLIGKTVTVASSDTVLKDGKATWGYELDETAVKATLTVTDSKGKVMWTGPAPDLNKGEHAFTWDGKGDHDGVNGEVYTLKVTAKNAADETIATQITMDGVVGSIRQGDSGPLIKVGGVDTSLGAVRGVKS